MKGYDVLFRNVKFVRRTVYVIVRRLRVRNLIVCLFMFYKWLLCLYPIAELGTIMSFSFIACLRPFLDGFCYCIRGYQAVRGQSLRAPRSRGGYLGVMGFLRPFASLRLGCEVRCSFFRNIAV
jgi:hypothetical protein